MVYAYLSGGTPEARNEKRPNFSGYTVDSYIEDDGSGSGAAIIRGSGVLSAGDTLLIGSLSELGLAVMETLEFSLETDAMAVELVCVLENVTSKELRAVREMDLEVKAEQEVLSRAKS